MHNIDLAIFEYIYEFTGNYYRLDLLGHILAKYLPYGLILILIILTVKDQKRFGITTLKAVVAGFFSTYLLALPIERLIIRKRPCDLLEFTPLIPKELSFSFPSSHAAFFFAFSTVVFFRHKKLGVFLYISSALIILARVYTGVHWPSDVLTGALLGLLTGLVLQKIIEIREGN